MTVPPPGTCPRCDHDTDTAHVPIATTGCLNDGGITLCRVKGCPCYGTWSVTTNPIACIPDRILVALMRQRVQQLPAGGDGDDASSYRLDIVEAALPGPTRGSDGYRMVLLPIAIRLTEYPSE